MGLSVTHILLVLAAVLLLFGRGKISELMGDLAKGIRSFKHGLADEGDVAPALARAQDRDPTLADRKRAGHDV
ncbi:twin-arginine translocase TatA/TatE family subunit [Hyphomicrobium sp.]|uniref:twin-arginine translocase TatA/TatE family subunit n=1 Tax=Hyphomicrobium sp. TaxID=82 RepID=UPI003FA54E04